MNLTFDLQLFASDVTVLGGVSVSGKEYTLGNVSLSDTIDGSGATVASFNAGTVSCGLGTGSIRTSYTVGDALVTFGTSVGSASVPSAAALGGGDSYTWRIYSDTINKLQLGKNVNAVLAKTAGNVSNLRVGTYGGSSVKFDNSQTIKLNMTEADTIGGVAFLGDRGNVSLLSGSLVWNATVSGSSGEVISIASGNSSASVLKLKGSGSEAFVSLGSAQATLSATEVNGFDKITFSAAQATDRSDIELTAVKSSNVLIEGASVASVFDIGSDVTGQSTITIKGGNQTAGQQGDTMNLSGKGVEIIVMGNAATSGTDTISNWLESKGDTAKGNTISLKGGMSSLILGTVANGSAQVNQDTTSGATYSVGSTITSSDKTTGSNKLGVNVITDDGTYSALLFGKAELTSQQGIKFDNYDYLIADKNKTLNLGTTNKTTVVLANSVDEKHWGDTSVYQNVVTVASSGKGKSLIINGKENDSMYASLSGSNDSVWGANNLVGDEITLTKEKSQVVFTGANDGLDSINGYVFGSSASKANAIRFLDGIGYVSAGKQNLTFGADENNGVEVSLNGATSGDKVAYGFGTEGDKYVAMVDATENGKGQITYGSDVNVYIGQGDNSFIKIDSTAKDVKLGWDGGAGYVSIGGVDAAMAADGAVIVGTTDNAQSIAGSSRGASSISGGFVADKWTDDNADTLVGGGVATKSTTFFVGDKMGRDEIQNLSSKDNIVFLGSKYEDLVKFSPEATENSLTFKFSNGNTIEASVVSGRKLSNLTDVSLYFDDGTYVWNGSEFAKSE